MNPSIFALKMAELREAKLAEEYIPAYMKQALGEGGKDQAGNPKILAWDPQVNYTAYFLYLANQVFHRISRMPEEIKDNIMADALAHTFLSPENRRTYNPNFKKTEKDGKEILEAQNPPQTFFGKIFLNKVKDEFNKYMTDLKHTKQNPLQEKLERTDVRQEVEEVLDHRKVDPHEKKALEEFIASWEKHLHGTSNSHYWVPMFHAYMSNMSSADLIKQGLIRDPDTGNVVSAGRISQLWKAMKYEFANFASTHADDSLMSLITDKIKKLEKKGSVEEEEDGPEFFKSIFEAYVGSDQGDTYKPAGKVNTVIRTTLEADPLDEDRIASQILSPSVTSEDMEAELDEYVGFLNAQDDVLEGEDGKIVGLKVQTNDVRTTEAPDGGGVIQQAPLTGKKEAVKAFIAAIFAENPHTQFRISSLASQAHAKFGLMPMQVTITAVQELVQSNKLYRASDQRLKVKDIEGIRKLASVHKAKDYVPKDGSIEDTMKDALMWVLLPGGGMQKDKDNPSYSQSDLANKVAPIFKKMEPDTTLTHDSFQKTFQTVVHEMLKVKELVQEGGKLRYNSHSG